MPDSTKYKSIAVPITAWNDLMDMARPNHRSAGQQITFLINIAKEMPSNRELLEYFKGFSEEKQNGKVGLEPEADQALK